eukprot:Rmarinus@m.7486
MDRNLESSPSGQLPGVIPSTFRHLSQRISSPLSVDERSFPFPENTTCRVDLEAGSGVGCDIPTASEVPQADVLFQPIPVATEVPAAPRQLDDPFELVDRPDPKKRGPLVLICFPFIGCFYIIKYLLHLLLRGLKAFRNQISKCFAFFFSGALCILLWGVINKYCFSPLLAAVGVICNILAVFWKYTQHFYWACIHPPLAFVGRGLMFIGRSVASVSLYICRQCLRCLRFVGDTVYVAALVFYLALCGLGKWMWGRLAAGGHVCSCFLSRTWLSMKRTGSVCWLRGCHVAHLVWMPISAALCVVRKAATKVVHCLWESLCVMGGVMWAGVLKTYKIVSVPVYFIAEKAYQGGVFTCKAIAFAAKETYRGGMAIAVMCIAAAVVGKKFFVSFVWVPVVKCLKRVATTTVGIVLISLMVAHTVLKVVCHQVSVCGHVALWSLQSMIVELWFLIALVGMEVKKLILVAFYLFNLCWRPYWGMLKAFFQALKRGLLFLWYKFRMFLRYIKSRFLLPLYRAMRSFARWTLAVVRQVWDAVRLAALRLYRSVAAVARATARAVRETAAAVVTVVRETATAVATAVRNVVVPIAVAVRSAVHSAAAAVTSSAVAVSRFIGGVARSVHEAVVAPVGRALRDTATASAQVLRETAEAVKAAVKDTLSATKHAVIDAKNAIRAMFR